MAISFFFLNLKFDYDSNLESMRIHILMFSYHDQTLEFVFHILRENLPQAVSVISQFI